MEMPHLGKQCAYTKCETSYLKNRTVPVCPLCNSPIAVGRDEDPNIKVDEHISKGCKESTKATTYSNKCSYGNCKAREAIPVNCASCRKVFCLKHRHEQDHKCTATPQQRRAPQGPARTQAALAAQARAANSRPNPPSRQTPPPSQVPAATHSLSEEEQLQLAIAASLADAGVTAVASQQQLQQQRQQQNSTCALS
eukprot:Colp12_sorted_trinity150504_noHs@7637